MGNGRTRVSESTAPATLTDWEALSVANAEINNLVGQLANVTASRLRLNGADSELGNQVIAIAAALSCGSQPALSRLLLKSIHPAPSYGWEWIVRHGLVAPALKYLSPAIADELRLISPLTSILERPAVNQEDEALVNLQSLLAQADTRECVVLHFARPVAVNECRNWRQDTMSRLRRGSELERCFVLDVYEAAAVHHATEVAQQIKAAKQVMGRSRCRTKSNSLTDCFVHCQMVGTPMGD